MIQYTKESEILKDTKPSGKEINWRGKKIGSIILEQSLRRLGFEKKAIDTNLCGGFIDFAANSNDLDDKKLHQAYFCKNILCPICAMRRSDKLKGQTFKVINHIEDKQKFRYIFLTLTVRNMIAGELKNAIDEMMRGFNLLTKRKEFRAMSQGWMRALEVTHNWQENTYHPHLHMIIVVDKDYFDEYENYIDQKRWRELWQSCMGLDYDPWVSVKKVRKSKEKAVKDTISYAGAVSELAKYPVKSNDYAVTWRGREAFLNKTGIMLRNKEHAQELTDRVVGTLTEVLFNRRLVARGGIWRTAHKLLNLDDPENGNLIDTDQKQEDEVDGKYTILLRYRFDRKMGQYCLDQESSFIPINGYRDRGPP